MKIAHSNVAPQSANNVPDADLKALDEWILALK